MVCIIDVATKKTTEKENWPGKPQDIQVCIEFNPTLRMNDFVVCDKQPRARHQMDENENDEE